LQLHAGAAPQLRDRRTFGRALAGDPEQRRDPVRRQRPGQHGRRGGSAGARPRAHALAVAHPAAAVDRLLQGDDMSSVIRTGPTTGTTTGSTRTRDALRPWRRAIIESITPQVDGGRFAAKRSVGDRVVVEADAFTDGHDVLRCRVKYRHDEEKEW